MIRQTLIFDAIPVVTDAYKADFARAKKEYDTALKELRENFLINSPMYLKNNKECRVEV